MSRKRSVPWRGRMIFASRMRCRKRVGKDNAAAPAGARLERSGPGDVTTLEDFSVLEKLREDEE